MSTRRPTAELEAAFSSPDAVPTEWDEARAQVAAPEIHWLSTVRPDGRPRVTPLVSVCLDGAAWFTTGATERKACRRCLRREVPGSLPIHGS